MKQQSFLSGQLKRSGNFKKGFDCYKLMPESIRAIEEMKERFGIVNIVKEIQETDIPKLAHYADKEANPLYPVPKLMDASELEKFYYMLMSLTSEKGDCVL